jgi:hypothetical protein
MRRTLRPLTVLAMVALISVISVISAGCGSNAPSKTGTASSSGSGTGSKNAAREKGMKFAECMRDNGVSAFPDPDASGELTIDAVANGSSLDTNAAAFKKAISACRDLKPPGFTGHKRSAQKQEIALKFAQCMRDNGVRDFPDPTPNGPLIDTNLIPSAAGRGARSIPGFVAATHKCGANYSAEPGLKGP